eukprot:TRINITY_DN4593_c0_g1_i1.p1 TRINITY_DN4593_c0_g1~~TRINITY_DN4593_c0_g1_i1.p1  ORF type:complete len:661 (-),score=204.19 TRINITY_DN4593_c0_g1_i1:198-1910(-)
MASARDNAMDDGTFVTGFAAPAISPLQQQPATAANDWCFSAAHFGGGGFESPTTATRSPGGWLWPNGSMLAEPREEEWREVARPPPRYGWASSPSKASAHATRQAPAAAASGMSLMCAAALIDSESDSDSDSTTSGLDAAAAQAPPAAAAAASTQAAARRGSNSGSSSGGGGDSGSGHGHRHSNATRGRGSTAAAEDIDIDAVLRELDEKERAADNKERNNGRKAEKAKDSRKSTTGANEQPQNSKVAKGRAILLGCSKVAELAVNNDGCPCCTTCWEVLETTLQKAVLFPCDHAVCIMCLAQQRTAAKKGPEDELVCFRCPFCRNELRLSIINKMIAAYLEDADADWLWDVARCLQQRRMCGNAEKLLRQLPFNKSFDIARVSQILCNWVDMALEGPRMKELNADNKQRIRDAARAPLLAMEEDIANKQQELAAATTPEHKGQLQAELERLQANHVDVRRNAASNIFEQLNSVGRMGAVVVTEGVQDAAHLDLHGLKVDEAMVKIEDFVLPCFPAVQRIVLITGRGKHSAGGVPTLRDCLLQWLGSLGYLCKVVTNNPGQLLLQPRQSG